MWRNLAKYSGVNYSVVRATVNALNATARVDFIDLGSSANIYKERDHNLTQNFYKYNGNIVEFFSSDNDEKVRGRKQHVLYLNEAPEIEWNIVQQLLFRTSEKIILDYNPSYPESWVYDNILTRNDCAFIRTTYKDNPFLTLGQLDEIEWMRVNDPDSYLVYGLGERGELKGQVYKNWTRCKELPKHLTSYYSIDFGFANSETCISEFKHEKRTVWGKEHVYKTGLDNLQIAIYLWYIGCDENSIIIVDSAEPKSIREIRLGWGLEMDYLKGIVFGMGLELSEKQYKDLQRALSLGFPVMPAKKGQDSVDAGIQRVRQHEVLITEDSHNAWNEFRQYRYAEDKLTGRLLNEPIKKFDHFCDTLRYFCMSEGIYY